MQKIYSANQIATLLGIPYSTVRNCMDKGELPYFTLPGSKQKRILEDDFIRFKETADLPSSLSKAIIVEVGQRLLVQEGNRLTTYTVLDVTKSKLVLAPVIGMPDAYYPTRIGGMV